MNHKNITSVFCLLALSLLLNIKLYPFFFNLNNDYDVISEIYSKPNKKVTIFTSKGGGGHTSVSRALEEFLKSGYETKRVNLITEILHPIDIVRTLTFNKYSGEDFYNYCLRKQWVRTANNFVWIGKKLSVYRRRTTNKLIRKYLDKEKPDIIVSVMPIFNHSLLKEAQRRDIPLVIITNDLDTANYINGIRNPNYKKFKYILSFDDEQIKNKIKRAQLKESQVEFLGFPIRPDFFLEKNVPGIKKDFNLPDNKPIVMVLMGAAGSSASYLYAKQLSKLDVPAHIVFCMGRNKSLGKKISKLKFNPKVSKSIIGFTRRISDLMAASQVIITKGGPNTICEAKQMDLPMIIDSTKKVLFWEKLNLSFVKKNGFGSIVKRFKDVNPILKKYLTDKKYYAEIKSNLRNSRKINFGANIKNLFDDMSEDTLEK